MASRIELSRRAEQDIDEIFLWIHADAPTNAVRWRRKLEEHLKLLELPELRFGLSPENDDSDQEVRQLLFGRYRILYTLRDEIAYVLTVRHGSRQFMSSAEIDTL